ncbi:MAG: hypothetical protein ABI557_10315, partial [Aureliella sp.]
EAARRDKEKLAQKKLAENNLYPAERLLDSHWGQYLFRYQPTTEMASKRTILTSASQSVVRTSRNKVQSSVKTTNETNMTPIGPSKGHGTWSQSPSVFHQMRDSLRSHWQR